MPTDARVGHSDQERPRNRQRHRRICPRETAREPQSPTPKGQIIRSQAGLSAGCLVRKLDRIVSRAAYRINFDRKSIAVRLQLCARHSRQTRMSLGLLQLYRANFRYSSNISINKRHYICWNPCEPYIISAMEIRPQQLPIGLSAISKECWLPSDRPEDAAFSVAATKAPRNRSRPNGTRKVA